MNNTTNDFEVSSVEMEVAVPANATAREEMMASVIDGSKLPKSILKMREHIAMLTKQTVQHKRDLMNTCAELRSLELMMDKYIINLAKKDNKNKQKKPSGFALPVPITPAVAEFMGINPVGVISRTEVTKFINKYIETRKLQCADNKKTFIPDGALMKLLQVTTPEPIAYFDIQRKLNVYFNKQARAAADGQQHHANAHNSDFGVETTLSY